MLRLVWPLLAAGILLVMIGIALLGGTEGGQRLLLALFLSLSGGITLLGLSVRTRRFLRNLRQDTRLRTTRSELSETAARYVPLLHGEYSPYVIEAAEALGRERDMTAVPALLVVLQRCVDEQRPGWRDVAEALVKALAGIGDRRALEPLYRLENVRGIGIIPAIREAIAAIEPQTSLLRPGSIDGALSETLLRPAQGIPESDADPALLLRALEQET